MQLTLLYGVLPLPPPQLLPRWRSNGRPLGRAQGFGEGPRSDPSRERLWGKLKLLQIVINNRERKSRRSRRNRRDPVLVENWPT